MQSGKVPDSAITASSSANANSYAPYVGRLHFLSSGSGKYGSWAAGANNLYQWLQVDFGSWTQILAVLTQGRQDSNQWVKSYSLSYSYDGVFFKTFTNEHRSKQVTIYRKYWFQGPFWIFSKMSENIHWQRYNWHVLIPVIYIYNLPSSQSFCTQMVLLVFL